MENWSSWDQKSFELKMKEAETVWCRHNAQDDKSRTLWNSHVEKLVRKQNHEAKMVRRCRRHTSMQHIINIVCIKKKIEDSVFQHVFEFF